MKTWMLLLLLTGGYSSLAVAEDWILVTGLNSEFSEISQEDIRRVFLGKKITTHEGTRVQVYDNKSPELRANFYQKSLHLSIVQLRAYWAKRVFTGKGRPPKQLSTPELLEKLQQEKNVLSYVPSDAVGDYKTVIVN